MCVLLASAACQKSEPPAPRPAIVTHVTTTTVAGPVRDLKRANVDIKVDPDLPLATFLDSAAIGNKLGADGTVAAQLTTFKSTEPVYLTMRFKKSPVGLQSSVRVLDAAKKDVGQEFQQMNGANSVTFRIPPLKPGHYKISGYWGGNLACEYAVVVE